MREGSCQVITVALGRFPAGDIFLRGNRLSPTKTEPKPKRGPIDLFLWGSENEFAMLIAGKRFAKDADWALAQFLLGTTRHWRISTLFMHASDYGTEGILQPSTKKSKDEKQLVMPMTLEGQLCLIGTTKDTTAVDAKMPNGGEDGIGCENTACDCGGANSGGKQ